MVAVINGQRAIGFPEVQVLRFANGHARVASGRVGLDSGRRLKHLPVEVRDTGRHAGGYFKLDVGHAELDAAEALLVRRVTADAVAPWTRRLDVRFVLGEFELRVGKLLFDRR